MASVYPSTFKENNAYFNTTSKRIKGCVRSIHTFRKKCIPFCDAQSKKYLVLKVVH